MGLQTGFSTGLFGPTGLLGLTLLGLTNITWMNRSTGINVSWTNRFT